MNKGEIKLHNAVPIVKYPLDACVLTIYACPR
jgi:hypothetical protein